MFQTFAAATGKARSPMVLCNDRGTCSDGDDMRHKRKLGSRLSPETDAIIIILVNFCVTGMSVQVSSGAADSSSHTEDSAADTSAICASAAPAVHDTGLVTSTPADMTPCSESVSAPELTTSTTPTATLLTATRRSATQTLNILGNLPTLYVIENRAASITSEILSIKMTAVFYKMSRLVHMANLN